MGSQSRAPRPHLAGQRREAGEKLKHKTTNAMPRPETQESKRARWTPSARSLPRQPPLPRQEPCRGNLPRQGSCRGCGGSLSKDHAEGVHLALLLSCVFGLGIALVVASLRLPSSALLSVAAARGSDRPRTSKGFKRRAPNFVHRQEPPGLGHTKARRVVGLGPERCAGRWGGFYRSNFSSAVLLHDPC